MSDHEQSIREMIGYKKLFNPTTKQIAEQIAMLKSEWASGSRVEPESVYIARWLWLNDTVRRNLLHYLQSWERSE